MMQSPPRVAFFADSFHEVNGAARTCRMLEQYARKHQFPMLSIHCGAEESETVDGEVTVLQLRRGSLAFPIDSDLRVDPLMQLRYRRIRDRVRAFGPDIVHLTGPGDLGILGATIAGRLKKPIAMAWHTNVHEFAGLRLRKTFRFLPAGADDGIARVAEEFIFWAVTRFYSLGNVFLAPTPELIGILEKKTRRPGWLMTRGVDTDFFSPEKRARTDSDFVIGYVGRLMPEKSVRYLVDLEKALLQAGMTGFRFLIVGGGEERAHLEAVMKHAEFGGVLSGDALARAYANMDLFVFPSRTDTFGNVVQEAMASGLPAVVTAEGGPKFIVQEGVTGFVGATEAEMTQAVLRLTGDRALYLQMKAAAREYALSKSWDAVFDSVYEAYRMAIAGKLSRPS